MKRKIASFCLCLICGLVLFGIMPSSTHAIEKLKVVTKTIEPFVMKDSFTGFSMDIWKEIADDLKVDYEYYRVNTVNDLLFDVQGGEADLAIAAITINSDRVNNVDFSHPFYDSGLQILVPADNGEASLDFEMFIPILKVLGVLFLAMFLASHLIWFGEHGEDKSDFSDHYIQGIWDAFWWSAVTVTTVGYGDKTPKKVSGRIVGIIWMFIGLFLIAYFTSSVTSSFTVQKLNGNINSVDDLKSKLVATVDGTTSMKYLISQDINNKVYANFDEAIEGLNNGETDAFIFDAPVLQYYIQNGGDDFKVVGKIFKSESYGIAMEKDSKLRKDINRSILKMHENGVYDTIYKKWFGEM